MAHELEGWSSYTGIPQSQGMRSQSWQDKIEKRQPGDGKDYKQGAPWIISDVLMHDCCDDDDAMISDSGIGGITCNSSQITSQALQAASQASGHPTRYG